LVGTLHSSCGFAGNLNGGQEKGDEHADDGNDDEKFDESETSFSGAIYCVPLIRAAIARLRLT
jgi:hypothetical protein